MAKDNYTEDRLLEIQDKLINSADPFRIFGMGVYAVAIRTVYKDMSLGRLRILYIGSSKDMGKRVYKNTHPYMICFNRFGNHCVFMLSYATEDYINLERILIKRMNPVLNINRN